jgi:periplasmic copper chaperone A
LDQERIATGVNPRRRREPGLGGKACVRVPHVKFVTVLGATAVLTVLAGSTASAHVAVSPDTAVGGSEAQLTFRAPDEEAAAQFTKLVIHLPAAQPLASLATRPIPGWTASLTKSKLPKPITTDDSTATEYTSTITWSATDGGVAPDQY